MAYHSNAFEDSSMDAWRTPRLPVRPARVTYIIIGINILIFLLDLGGLGGIIGLGGVNGVVPLSYIGSLIPARVLIHSEWWRLLATGFLHAGVMHIASNLYALYIIGPQVERLFRAKGFIWIYLTSLLGGSALVTLLSPLNRPTVGASGAILGLMGALLVYLWQYRDLLSNARNSVSRLASVIMLNLIIGLVPGVSLWGHLGGFLAGSIAAWAILPRYGTVSAASAFSVASTYSPWTRLEVKSGGWIQILKIVAVLWVILIVLVISLWVRV
jgi:membrane associated rhomboid family serine protease